MYRTFASNGPKIIFLWQLLTVYCQKSEFLITKAVHCNVPGLKFMTEDIAIYNYNSKGHLRARLLVTENIKALKSLHIHVERCNDQGHHCESFLNLRIEKLCQMVSSKNQYWSKIVEKIHPLFRCPIKKATYEVRNATIDLDGITNWYPDMSKYHWRSTCKVLNERDVVIACEILDVDIHENKKQEG